MKKNLLSHPRKCLAYARYLSVLLLFLCPAGVFSQDLTASIVKHGGKDTYQASNQTESLKALLNKLEEHHSIFINYESRIVDGIDINSMEADKVLEVPQGNIEELENSVIKLLSSHRLDFKRFEDNNYIIVKKEGEETGLKKIEKKSLNFVRDRSSLDGIDRLQTRWLARMQQPQEKTIRGKVTGGDDGQSLPGVNVLAQNTTIGTVTDIDGNYTLAVPDETQVLVFSSVGYMTEEVQIGGRSIINIELSPDITALSEVVVIGYGTQERRDLTGAVSSVKSEDIVKLPNVNVQQAMQGRAPGVVVTENSGRPGAAATVQIRGIGTVGNSDPLYVVDGQILNSANGIESLNPNDIESIEILKDASASAIYGARAANGVVLITTKRGTEGKTKLSYHGYAGPQWFNDRLEFMNAQEFVQDAIDRAAAQGETSVWNDDPSDPTPESFGEGINYWDKLWRTGHITDHTLSLSGGNESTQFLVSLGYLDNKGVMIGQSFERYSVRLNTDHQLTPWLKIGQSLQLSRANEVAIGGTGGFNSVFESGWRMKPTIVPERFPDGSWNGPTRPGEPFNFSTFNPRQFVEEWDELTKQWRALGNVYAEVEFFEGLKFRSTYSGFFGYNDGTSWRPQLVNAGGAGNATVLSRSTNTTTNWQLDNILTYTKSFGPHNLSALAGYTSQENRFENLNAGINDFLDESVVVINGGNPETLTGSGGITDWALNSIIGRITYDFDGKYLFQANIRADGSSRFGEGNRWGYFPSFSAGWRLSEEEFFNVPAISDLKLRGSWGQLGNDQIGLYAFAAAVNLSQRYTLGTDQIIQPGAAPLQLANQDIKWEETTQIDVGLDLGLFENTLLITLDYFVKNTDDMLLQVPIPLSSGYTSAPFVNAGSVENKGWELSTTYRKYSGEFTWDATLNLSTVQNEVTALGSGERIITGANNGDQIADVGTEVFAFFGYQAEGLYQNQAELDAVNALNPEREYDPGAVPGAVRFTDIDGDGLITDEDRTIIGSPYPDLSYGLNFSAQYANFDVTLFLQGTLGNELLIANNDNFAIQPGGLLRYNLDRWYQEGDTNDPVLWGVGGFQNASGGRDGRSADYMVFDGSYMRVKNLQLGYTIPSTLTDRIGLSRLRVYISSKNLLTIWDRPEYNFINDPELGREGSGFGKFNLVTTPQTTTISFGVNLDI